MIGTSIRSVRHLFRVSDTSFKTILVKFRENAWDICKVMKMPKESPFGEFLVIFNNHVRQCSYGFDNIVNSKDFKACKGYDDVIHNYGRILGVSKNDVKAYDNFFQEITLLPDSFDADYDKFLKENSKMISNLMSTFGFATRDIRVKRLYIYTEGSKNFFQWAMTLYYKNGIQISTIKSILLWNESYKQLTKNLSKGTITAYTTKDLIVVLLKELSELRKEKRINDSINSFNTNQKKMLKENELNEDTKQALWRLSRLSETKRLNFIKKMSSVDDFNELIRQLKFVTSVHFSWSKESFMDFITNVEGIKYEKIYENDNVVLVKAIDYETIKQLGKTTNWCISKNKQYWNNYIENHHGMTTQYMVFDFSKVEDDKLSIIGFTTTRNKGITSAHNFINEDLMGANPDEQVLLNSFISRFKDNKNIYSILSDDGIDITLVVEYDMPQYEWNQESLLKYLYECVNKENVDIIKSDENKLVLSVTDSNIRYFFSDAYHDNISSDYYALQHIIFIDFNKSKYDVNKIQFGIIEEGYGDEDYCIGVFNERSLNEGKNFDSLLIEYNLPYNIIRRTNNSIVRLRNAIASYNTPMMHEALKECSTNDLLNVLRNEFGMDSLYDMTLRTIRSYMSYDYLNLLYDNGLKLKDVMDFGYISSMIKNFASDMRSISRATNNFTNMNGITNDEIDKFYNFNIERREDAKYIGYYLAIKKIIEHEPLETKHFSDLLVYITTSLNRQVEVYEQIINLIKDKLDYNSKCDGINYLVKYAIFYGSQEIKEFILEKGKTHSNLQSYITRHSNDFKAFVSKESKKKKSTYSELVDDLDFVFANPF